MNENWRKLKLRLQLKIDGIRNEYELGVRVRKRFSFDYYRRIVLYAELFNVPNFSNVHHLSGGTIRYCSSLNYRKCGFNGPTNSGFLQVRDTGGDLITLATFAGTQVFQA